MALLEILELGKNFGGLMAVNDLSFFVNDGEIVGLIGPNGAGKTTVFNLITGFLRSSHGSVMFQGKDISGLIPERIAELGIVRTFQANSVFTEMSALANIMMGFYIHAGTRLWGDFFNTHRYRKRQCELTTKSVEILNMVGLAKLGSSLAGSLSHGHQRALQLAIALAAQPKILMLDEPVAGMSEEEAEVMMSNIARVRDMGVSILLVEHNMRTVMSLCSRIVVLNGGQKLAEGSPQEISQDKKVIEAYLGTEE